MNIQKQTFDVRFGLMKVATLEVSRFMMGGKVQSRWELKPYPNRTLKSIVLSDQGTWANRQFTGSKATFQFRGFSFPPVGNNHSDLGFTYRTNRYNCTPGKYSVETTVP